VPKRNVNLGALAEDKARAFLEANGYQVLFRNYRTRLGEIDIIARDKDTLCFIEVKKRSSDRFGSGLEAVTASKQRQISKAALSFLKDKGLLDQKARFDVVSLDPADGAEKITLVRNAFELDGRFTY